MNRPEISEMDCNPVIVWHDGARSWTPAYVSEVAHPGPSELRAAT